jgi:hypothetical protein
VSEHERPVERTFDWYAQDKHGNVWYMGEDSLELKHGRFVKASDSWQSGVNGAKPGIIMPGNPQPGEFSPLEPQTEKKYYVSGVGEVAERVVKGHHERFQLVSVTH